MDRETFNRWVRPWLAGFRFLIPPTYTGPWSAWRGFRISRSARAERAGTPGSISRP